MDLRGHEEGTDGRRRSDGDTLVTVHVLENGSAL